MFCERSVRAYASLLVHGKVNRSAGNTRPKVIMKPSMASRVKGYGAYMRTLIDIITDK